MGTARKLSVCGFILWGLLYGAIPAARAQLAGTDTLPGQSCAGFPAGAARLTADTDMDGRNITLICAGGIWTVAGMGDGGMKVGYQAGCAAEDDGTIRYLSAAVPPWEYCDGSAWRPFRQPLCQDDSAEECYLAPARSDSDPDFIAQNIRSGKNILGVQGALTGCVPPPLCPAVGDICNDGNAGTVNDPQFAGYMYYGVDHPCVPLFMTAYRVGWIWWKSASGNANDIAADSWTDGRANTDQIAASATYLGNSDAYPAFKLCIELTDGGFTDWYLPSWAELNLLWENRTEINMQAVDALVNETWSSTEDFNVTSSTAWKLDMTTGDVFVNLKTNGYAVRCVRR